ncbi:MAG: flagellar biosynthesis anti-sigma factor FlgM [Planctomycetota bacterium]|jgi:anti-sigma28 factor (negative regulator of flagellin synthesis)
MPEIPSIGQGSVGPVNRAAGVTPPSGRLQPHERNGRTGDHDRVELSAHTRLLDRLLQLPEVRMELVEKVRQAIAAGTYETPEKLEVAVDQLLRDELA